MPRPHLSHLGKVCATLFTLSLTDSPRFMAMMNYCCVADFSTASPRDSLIVPQQPPEEPKPRRSRSLRSRFRRPSHGGQLQEKPEMADVTINTPTADTNHGTIANREGPGDSNMHMTEKGNAAAGEEAAA